MPFLTNCQSGKEDAGNTSSSASDELVGLLDQAAQKPILNREWFPEPILIETVKLLHHKGSFICKITARNGAEGFSVSNNLRMDYLYPIFLKRVAPFFVGKDARYLENLIDEVYKYKSNYKMQSYALGVPVATVEFAILDLLGKVVGKSISELLGGMKNSHVPVYLAGRFRHLSAEESLEKIAGEIREKSYRAVKFKIGAKMGNNKEQVRGRTENLISMARESLPEKIWLGVDANGGYDVREAVRIGKLLEDYNYGFFEEPVPFDWYEETRQVADALKKIAVAGGEQESSLRNFRRMVIDDTLQVYRPDMFYFGGMIRSIKVARMAHIRGFSCVPHLSGSGLGYLYAMLFVSVIDNAGDYHPNTRDSSNPIPIECDTSSLQVEDGSVKVPTGPGMGVEIDPDFLKKHRALDSRIG